MGGFEGCFFDLMIIKIVLLEFSFVLGIFMCYLMLFFYIIQKENEKQGVEVMIAVVQVMV